MAKPIIYLFSSNSRLKYLKDDILSLLLPRRGVIHFRYLAKYVSPALRHQIEADSRELKGRSVLVCYLASIKASGTYYYPLRYGRIADIQVVGEDIHIFFEVNGYPTKPGVGSPVSISARQAHTSGGTHAYVAEGQDGAPELTFESQHKNDDNSFNAIVDSFSKSHWVFYENDVAKSVEPVFARIRGFYKQRRWRGPKLLQPSNIITRHELGYRLRGGSIYTMDISFRSPKWSIVPAIGASIEYTSSDSLFLNPATSRLEVRSHYDIGEFVIAPKPSEFGWISQSNLQFTEATLPTTNCNTLQIGPQLNLWLKTGPYVNPALALIVEGAYAIVPVVAILFTVLTRTSTTSTAPSTKTATSLLSVIPAVDWYILGAVGLLVLLRAVIRRGLS